MQLVYLVIFLFLLVNCSYSISNGTLNNKTNNFGGEAVDSYKTEIKPSEILVQEDLPFNTNAIVFMCSSAMVV